MITNNQFAAMCQQHGNQNRGITHTLHYSAFTTVLSMTASGWQFRNVEVFEKPGLANWRTINGEGIIIPLELRDTIRLHFTNAYGAIALDVVETQP
jgi:hypothetical protein